MKYNIEKLYLDCIDDSGNCFIIYRAELDLSFLRLHYSGFIFSDTKGEAYERSSIKKSDKPVIDDSILLDLKTFIIEGRWKRSDTPFKISLYKDPESKELIWDCHHPRAMAEIKCNGNTYKGLGYAETLSLPMKPWELPIDELRWGRFLSDSYTVIWIRWKGKVPVNRIFLNGIEKNDAIFHDENISFGEGVYKLEFSDIAIIRKGRLLNLFTRFSFLKILFDRRILNTMEIKYKAKTIFSKHSSSLSEGWSLFEIVTWAK
jgi:hypothetical protein